MTSLKKNLKKIFLIKNIASIFETKSRNGSMKKRSEIIRNSNYRITHTTSKTTRYYYILCKNPENSIYYLVRGQEKYIQKKKKEFLKNEFITLIDKKEILDSIGFFNELKSRIKEVNSIHYKKLIQDFKNSTEYKVSDNKKTVLKMFCENCKIEKENKLINLKGNKINLSNYTEEDLLKLFNSINFIYTKFIN